MNFFRTSNLGIQLLIVIWLGLAVYLGSLVGTGNFQTLKYAILALLFLGHLCFLIDRTWSLAFGLCVLDLYLLGFGFRISSTETVAAVVIGLVVLVSWRNRRFQVPALCQGQAFRFLNASLLLFLIYLGIHLVFNHTNPFRPQDYALKSFARTVAGTGSGLLALWLLIRNPRTCLSQDRLPQVLGGWLGVAILFHLSARVYEIWAGSQLVISESNVTTAFFIPILEAAPNMYALRTVPILGIIVGMIYLHSPWIQSQTLSTRLLFRSLIALSLLGALLSGGRTATIFSFGLIPVLSAWRGRYGMGVLAAIFLVLLLATLNTFPGLITKLPTHAQRSLALLVFTQETDARLAINDSSNWRWEVFNRSLQEWNSDPRIFWVGRGSYAWTEADEILMREDGYESTIDSTIRRGSTHNLITDLLLVHGLVGLILYLLCLASLSYFIFQTRKPQTNDPLGQCLANICWWYFWVSTVFAVFGGGMIPMPLCILVGLLVGRLYRLEMARLSSGAPEPRGATAVLSSQRR